MKKIIGYFLLALPFIVLFIVGCIETGFVSTTIAFIFTAMLLVIVVAGVHLIEE